MLALIAFVSHYIFLILEIINCLNDLPTNLKLCTVTHGLMINWRTLFGSHYLKLTNAPAEKTTTITLSRPLSLSLSPCRVNQGTRDPPVLKVSRVSVATPACRAPRGQGATPGTPARRGERWAGRGWTRPSRSLTFAIFGHGKNSHNFLNQSAGK